MGSLSRRAWATGSGVKPKAKRRLAGRCFDEASAVSNFIDLVAADESSAGYVQMPGEMGALGNNDWQTLPESPQFEPEPADSMHSRPHSLVPSFRWMIPH